MEQAIAFAVGTSLVVIGLSCLFRRRDWAEWLKHMREHSRRVSLTIGMAEILLGGFIVGFHWVWQGWGMVLTIIGVLAMLEATTYLLFPGLLARLLKRMEPHYHWMLPVGGIITIALGGIILCEWWHALHPECIWHPCYDQAMVPVD